MRAKTNTRRLAKKDVLPIDGVRRKRLRRRVLSELERVNTADRRQELERALEGCRLADESALIRTTRRTLEQLVPGRTVELTPRQHQVLELLLGGLSNKEIAARVGGSPRTIEVHVAQILRRHGVPSRMALLAQALTQPRRNG